MSVKVSQVGLRYDEFVERSLSGRHPDSGNPHNSGIEITYKPGLDLGRSLRLTIGPASPPTFARFRLDDGWPQGPRCNY